MKLSFTCIIFRASLWFQIISYSRMPYEAYFCTFVQNQIYYFIRQIHKMEKKKCVSYLLLLKLSSSLKD